MTNTYRALTPNAVAVFADGVFDADFSPTEESDWLASGLIELVPRRYRVLSNNFAGHAQLSEFDGAFLIENEAALIAGGHIERVDGPPAETNTTETE